MFLNKFFTVVRNWQLFYFASFIDFILFFQSFWTMDDIRLASTLILVAGNELVDAPPKLVTIKRGSHSNYLPGTFAFPGGNFDEGDEHVDWLSIIPPEERDIYLSTETSSPIPRALSLRITAIRETFEECGILLCKAYNTPKTDKVTPLFINDSKGWREKIHKNSYEFLNLCRSYRCHPDVRNLYLVNTWITPPTSARRYNCKFFVAVMDHIVDGDVNTAEIQSMQVGMKQMNCIGRSGGAIARD